MKHFNDFFRKGGNIMAGYYGYKMSNNAVLAYASGEKPYSRWKKQDIIQAIEKAIRDGDIELHFSMKMVKKIPLKELKWRALYCSSWHHTSKEYNRTDFYSIDFDFFNELTDEKIQEILDNIKPEEKPSEEHWKCKFLIWGGTKNHPTSKEIIEEGIVKGDWFYRKDGSKKKTTANGFEFLEKLKNQEND